MLSFQEMVAVIDRHTTNNVTNVVKVRDELEYQWAFDEIIELPFEDDAEMANWKTVVLEQLALARSGRKGASPHHGMERSKWMWSHIFVE